MIEMANSNGKGQAGNLHRDNEIEWPKNIKQIGEMNSGTKIYIEDYAFSYINSLAYQNSQQQQAGVLLGDVHKKNSDNCVFIKGVIRAKFKEEKITFNESVWSQVYSDIEKYFPNLTVVGWFASLPVIDKSALADISRLHIDNFPGKLKALYLINTVDKEEGFYLYEEGELKRQHGYVCFYERNYEMQEYMLDKRDAKYVEAPAKDNVVSSMREIMKEKQEYKKHKKAALLSCATCVTMAVLVLTAGVNLYRSYDRIKGIDESIESIAKLARTEMSTDADQITAGIVPVNVIYETIATKEQVTLASEEVSSVVVDNDAAAQTTEAEGTLYVVKEGDTVMGICKKVYGDTKRVQDIIERNDLEDANKLYIGQELRLP